MLNQFAIVAIGGALGAVCRFGLASWIGRQWPVAFPWGTLIVNLIGCLVIGRFMSSSLQANETWRLVFGIGFLGSFTTFSSFGAETFYLLRSGRTGGAAAYVAASVLVGLFAVWLGFRWGQGTSAV